MRLFILSISAFALLAACARENPDVCTALAPAPLMDDLTKNKNAKLDTVQLGYIASDCVITHARGYAASQDAGSEVARAVTAACKAQIESVENSLASDSPNNLELNDAVSKTLDENSEKAALMYVVEARAGHCSLDRTRTPVSIPNLLDWR